MCEKKMVTQEEKTDKYGKQVYISECLKTGAIIPSSESYDALAYSYPECKKEVIG